jgi:DNA mismatch repair ATPase MutS
VVDNDFGADGRSLVVVTGANQGGKSTFLRSLGLAQLMMQAGMFVAASRFQAAVVSGVFSHFKREEDPALRGGKLDEELRRMSRVVKRVSAGGLLLCNESFASTNEQEGSEIALELVRAMTEAGVKVVYVTHLFELANRLWSEGRDRALFLRAPRQSGAQPYKLVEGAPEPTAYGEDLYRRVFEEGSPLDNSNLR